MGIGALDVAMRDLLRAAIKESGLSVPAIATELTIRLKQRVTEHTLYGCTKASGHGVRFPASWVPVFCEITGDEELAIRLLPEHLREALRIGRYVRDAAGSLDRARDLISKLTSSSTQRRRGARK
jgi:hypothetical protein